MKENLYHASLHATRGVVLITGQTRAGGVGVGVVVLNTGAILLPASGRPG
jgi:hypothetical protein